MSVRWLDIHSHFAMLEDSAETVLARAAENNVIAAINIATCEKDIHQVYELSKKHFPKIFCALGIHPHDSPEWTPEIKAFIEEHVKEDNVACLGEMGLDYYYEYSDREMQKKAFREQLELSLKYDLPVQIHTRDAEEDTIEILNDMGGKFKGVIHCFTGTDYLAEEALKVGLNISISGIVTFKNAKELRASIEKVPLDRMHVETDSPFLAPVPMRGRKNEPSFVSHTAQFVADLKGVPLKDFCEQITQNNLKVFPKLAAAYQ
ncbi:MAG: TatD family hydrolase [Bdellovibrionota bacterium]|nr:TatD family hydrolase [Bdellovibrionota bacterium]